MKYLNALNKISGIGSQKMKLLSNFFSTPKDIWEADFSKLKESKIGEKAAQKICDERKNIDPDAEWEALKKENIQMITISDLEYPQILKEIHNPPFILYKKGTLDLNSLPMISVVGSRKYSSYGSQVAYSLSKDLSNAGVLIVSGMALGIDTFAHKGALDANGKTIAVLGNSLENEKIYPRNNFNLSKQIEENGAIISEYPLGTEAGPMTFPARNRIIAGLSLGTIVVEASEKSGSLITARMSLEYNREVFSVPGSIFSSVSSGTNNLIKEGAKVVTGAKDVLEELNLNKNKEIEKKSISKNPDSEEERKILSILSSDPLHIDNISKIAKLQPASCASTLIMMEMKGWIKNIGGQNYIII